MSLLPCLLSRLESTEPQVQIPKLNNKSFKFKWTVLLYPIRTFSFPNCVSALLSILPISLLLHKLQPTTERKKHISFFLSKKGLTKCMKCCLWQNRKKTQLYWFHIKSTTLVWLWKEGNAYHILFTWLKNYHYDLELRMKFQKECLYLFIYSFIYVLKTHIFFFINLALQDCLNHFCPIWFHNLILARNSLAYLLV